MSSSGRRDVDVNDETGGAGRSGASIHSARRALFLDTHTTRSMAAPPRNLDADATEAPPLGSWSRLYAIVIGELVLLIVLFTLFARAFR
jgi:hypothetical protein